MGAHALRSVVEPSVVSFHLLRCERGGGSSHEELCPSTGAAGMAVDGEQVEAEGGRMPALKLPNDFNRHSISCEYIFI